MIKAFLKSFQYALHGIWLFFQSEANAKIHLAISVLVIAGGFFFSINTTEWCLIVLAIAMVVSAEGMNTAIEYLTDLVSPDIHPLAGKTKDVAAGAVLLASIGAALIGCLIFIPKIWIYFF